LGQKGQDLLQTLVREAPQKKIDAFSKWLNKPDANDNQRRYILECLKTVSTPAALEAVEMFAREGEGQASSVIEYAKEIVASKLVVKPTDAAKRGLAEFERAHSERLFETLPKSVRNPFEENLEYDLIPAGEFRYSVSEKIESVTNTYFAKYPVTNKRYRTFINYLNRAELQLHEILDLPLFLERLKEFAKGTKGFREFLAGLESWPEKFRSGQETEKRFNQDEQPVVSVTWFAARAYCFWLSCMERVQWDQKLEDLEELGKIYRLPTEIEWEWAAAGREADGSLREYPWAKAKGEPNDKLANYHGNVGTTTPVGRYPDGATPEGLMDLAGNVWEWMENWSDKDEDARALRGGSWSYNADVLRCSSRIDSLPSSGYDVIGFRVVRSQSRI
jgi:formylglycine-generating enzyme required for sulfatase activity